MLSSVSVGKKESHCSTKLCTPVWFSIDSKGHLQARKKGRAEKLRKNCGKVRKIAENCGNLRNCGKLRTSIPPPLAQAEGCSRREEGSGLKPKSLCTKNGLNQIFSFANFIFSHCEIWVRGGGGYPTPPVVVSRS